MAVRMSKTETKLQEHLNANAIFSLVHSDFERIKIISQKTSKYPSSLYHLLFISFQLFEIMPSLVADSYCEEMFTKRQRNSPSLACVYRHNRICCNFINDEIEPFRGI